MITVLALHPGGLSAEQLATEVYGETGNPMTARAEVHRLRVQLGAAVVRAKPYRLNALPHGDPRRAILRTRQEQLLR